MSGIVNNIHKRFNFNEPKANHVIYELAAKFSFIICLVVAFFNTSLPFQERIRDVNDIATSNPVNQVVFSALFLSSTFSLIPLTNKLWRLIKREKFLTLFLLWCALSIIWSDFSFVSFKRFFQILTVVIVFEAILLHSSSTNTTVKFFKPILALYLILSFLSVLLVPGATDSTSGSWRGLTHTKNLLGQAALMNLIFWFNMFRFDSYKGKILSFSMTLISIILLLGSKSITAIITLIMLILLGLLVSSDRALFNRLNVGWTFSIVVLLSFGVLFLSTYFLAPDIIQALPNYFGKDSTFTGRIDLWQDLLNEIRNHPIFGCGFAGFWVIGNPSLSYIYEKYVWLPNQAHMGYLEIFNELGIIGLSLFIFMLIFYFKNLIRFNRLSFWKWFLLAALIINFQEATFFKPRHVSGVMLIFSYLSLYIELINHPARKTLVSNK